MSQLNGFVVPEYQVADYLQVAVWSKEDDCYVGSVPPLAGPSCHGGRGDVAKLFRDLDEIAEERLEILAEDELPIPAPGDADSLGLEYLGTPGDHILRCRLLDAKKSVLSEGAFQNEGGSHAVSWMPLPRVASIAAEDLSSAAYLHFSATLVLPIAGLRPWSNGTFEVLGFSDVVENGEVPTSAALHLIQSK